MVGNRQSVTLKRTRSSRRGGCVSRGVRLALAALCISARSDVRARPSLNLYLPRSPEFLSASAAACDAAVVIVGVRLAVSDWPGGMLRYFQSLPRDDLAR